MKYFVYIIKSKFSKNFYTGMTVDIERRLKEHNQKRSNTLSTKKLTDYELVFCQTVCDRQSARKLEKLLKSGWGREFRKEIVQYT